MVGTAIAMGIHSGMNIRITKQIGGGVIIILTRGMGEQLTYGIPARYRVILMERLGGLFFDGGRSCVGDSFRWSFGSVPLRVSRGEYTFLCVRFGREALNRSIFS